MFAALALAAVAGAPLVLVRRGLAKTPAGWQTFFGTDEAAPVSYIAGSVRVGQANYSVPTSGVKFVDLDSGSNTNTGAIDSPYRTVQRGVDQAAAGGTVVIRGGTESDPAIVHEHINTAGKAVTIQAYPLEAVWFDGSSVYSSWINNGNGTWTTSYSVTMARFSVASWPGTDTYRGYTDQVWVDGAALLQIGDNSTSPGSGQFSVNQSADTLTIGTNPAGKEVRVADLQTFLTATSVCNLKGFGVRRYSPQMIEDQSGLAFYGGASQGSSMENIVFQDSAVAGLSLTRADLTIKWCTFQDMNHTGLGGTTCDRMVVDQCVFRRLNKGLFDQAPATGGIKLTRADGCEIRHCWMEDIPKCNGIWFDVSCTRTSIYGNWVDGRDKGRGQAYTVIFVEISDGGIYGGVQYSNWVVGNDTIGGQYAGSCTGSGYTKFWNNTFTEYGVTGLNFGQDRGDNNEDPGNKTIAIVPWRNVGCESVNNRFGYNAAGGGIQLIAYSHWDAIDPQLYLGWQMLTKISGNWFRPAPPGTMVQMGKADKLRNSYNTLAALATGNASDGGPPGSKLGTNYVGTSTPNPALYAEPAPANVAAMLGIAAGDKLIGPNPANLPVLRPGI